MQTEEKLTSQALLKGAKSSVSNEYRRVAEGRGMPLEIQEPSTRFSGNFFTGKINQNIARFVIL